MGGFGGAVCEALADLGLLTPVLRMAIPDCFVHARRDGEAALRRRTDRREHRGCRARPARRHPRGAHDGVRRARSWRRRRPVTRSRIDVLLVERGLFPSREQARAALLAGEVRVVRPGRHQGRSARRRGRADHRRREAALRVARRREARGRARRLRPRRRWSARRRRRRLDRRVHRLRAAARRHLRLRGRRRLRSARLVASNRPTRDRLRAHQHPHGRSRRAWALRSTSRSSTSRSSRFARCCPTCSR